jgi:hypothetical protein
MSGAIEILNPEKPKRVLLLASNPTISEQTILKVEKAAGDTPGRSSFRS